jgi:hypothetical protein
MSSKRKAEPEEDDCAATAAGLQSQKNTHTLDDAEPLDTSSEKKSNRRGKTRKPKNRQKKKKVDKIFLRFAPPQNNAPLKLRLLQEAMLWVLGPTRLALDNNMMAQTSKVFLGRSRPTSRPSAAKASSGYGSPWSTVWMPRHTRHSRLSCPL